MIVGSQTPTTRETEKNVRLDPVCGMHVRKDSPRKTDYQAQSYYFCCSGCLEKFLKSSQDYTSGISAASRHRAQAHPLGSAPSHTDSASGMQQWTCPMHPEVVQAHPGACPKCGMALESMGPVRPQAADPELRSMTRRFWVSVILSIPLVLIAMRSTILHPLLSVFPGESMGLERVRAGNTGGNLGRPAIPGARLAFAGQSQPEHVHPHQPGRDRALSFQPDSDTVSGVVSHEFPHGGWR